MIKTKFLTLVFLCSILALSCEKEESPTIPESPTSPEENELIWNQEAIISNIAYIQNLSKTSNNEYIVSGLIGSDSRGLIRLSSEGNVLWAEDLSSINITSRDFQWFRLMKDDTYLIAEENRFVKYDTNFNSIWEITQNDDLTGHSYLITSDNGVF